jgi:hypothetical protein
MAARTNDYLIAKARSNAGPCIHLIENWVHAYLLAGEIDSPLQSNAERRLQYVANLDKPAKRSTLLSYARSVDVEEALTAR